MIRLLDFKVWALKWKFCRIFVLERLVGLGWLLMNSVAWIYCCNKFCRKCSNLDGHSLQNDLFIWTTRPSGQVGAQLDQWNWISFLINTWEPDEWSLWEPEFLEHCLLSEKKIFKISPIFFSRQQLKSWNMTAVSNTTHYIFIWKQSQEDKKPKYARMTVKKAEILSHK